MIDRLSYSADGNRLYAFFMLSGSHIYDVPGLLRWRPPQRRATLSGHKGPINSLDISPNGSRLATASDHGTAKIWDTQTARELSTLRGHRTRVEEVRYSPDGRTLLTTSREAGAPFREVKLWDAQTGKERPSIQLGVPPIYDMLFSPDGKYLAISQHCEVRLYDVTNGKVQQDLTTPKHSVSSLAFSPDCRTLAVATGRPGPFGDNGADIRLWELASGMERAVISKDPGEGRFRSLRFSPDGKLLAGHQEVSDGVTIWDLATRRESLVLKDARYPLFTPDSKSLISVVFAPGNPVRKWDLTTGKHLDLAIDNDKGVGYYISPNDRLLVTFVWVGDSSAHSRLWDVKTGRKLMVLEHQIAGAFTPDSKILAVLNLKGDPVLYDVETLVGKN